MAQPLSSLMVQITELALSTVLGSGYLGTRQVENRRLRGCAMAALIGRLGSCCFFLGFSAEQILISFQLQEAPQPFWG